MSTERKYLKISRAWLAEVAAMGEDRPEIRAVVMAAIEGRVRWHRAFQAIAALEPSLPPADYERVTLRERAARGFSPEAEEG